MGPAAWKAQASGKGDDREAIEAHAHLQGFRPCIPDSGTKHVKDGDIKHWSLHFPVKGDFHTHPYGSCRELIAGKGWEFFDFDRTSFPDEVSQRLLADGDPVSLVTSVTRSQAMCEGWATRQTACRWTFEIGQYRDRFCQSATAGRQNERGERKFTRSRVNLVPSQQFPMVQRTDRETSDSPVGAPA